MHAQYQRIQSFQQWYKDYVHLLVDDYDKWLIPAIEALELVEPKPRTERVKHPLGGWRDIKLTGNVIDDWDEIVFNLDL